MNAYAHWLLRNRWPVIVMTLLITALLGYFGSGLKVVIDPAALAPQGHPYIKATNRIDEVFGSKYMMMIGITPKNGDVFQPAVTDRVLRITRELENTPGIVKSTLISLGARQAKSIEGNSDGFEVRPLLEDGAMTPQDYARLKRALQDNPVYQNAVVSGDLRTAAILVELKERPDGFRKMVEPVKAIVEKELGDDVTITLGGNPVYLDKTENFAERINLLFPIAILVIGLLHFEAFRTKQGLILPLVTALMAVAWGMGFMGLFRQPLDIFNSPTPILILAIAAGHAVQLLKRYYEEYAGLIDQGKLSPHEANREAVIRSIVGVGPVMLIAGGIAALGFFSLLVFDIATIRAFGIFTGMGILSAVVLEMSFIPAIRSLLSPPKNVDILGERKNRVWDRIPAWIASRLLDKGGRRRLYTAIVALLAVSAVGMSMVVVDNSSKNFFASNLDIQKDDDFLNANLGGTNSLYIMVEGQSANSIKNPEVLSAMEKIQRFAEKDAYVGKTISIVDYLQQMNRAMNGNSPSKRVLPNDSELIAQYLLLYSMSGEPGDFDSYVDYDYQRAKITILLRTGSNAHIKQLVADLEKESQKLFSKDIRITFGGDVAQTIGLTETMVDGKLRNILQIGLAIFVVSAIAFRSLVAGAIVLTPLAMAVAAVFGVMGLFGIPLNIPNSLISAMAVGIGADYAIYLLYRMREEIGKGSDLQSALRNTLATAGKASLFVASAVAGGYGVLALSFGYNVHLWLSLFIVLAMLVSVMVSLVLVPGLVVSFRPNFILQQDRPRMAWGLTLVLLAGSVATLFASGQIHAAPPNPADVIQQSVDAIEVDKSFTDATFTLTNKDGANRVRRTVGYTRLQPNGSDNMRLVRFVSPADIKGTETLLIENQAKEDDMWVFLPALGKVRRLSASNKRDSFIGTDLSFGDVIGHKTKEWNHRAIGEETIDGAVCYQVESTPRDEAVKRNSGYSKRISWVRKDNYVAVRVDFWDTGGRALKRLKASELRQVNGKRWQAMLTIVENLQTGHRTTIRFNKFDTDQAVDANLFQSQRLGK
jgi:uncharacterized protein